MADTPSIPTVPSPSAPHGRGPITGPLPDSFGPDVAALMGLPPAAAPATIPSPEGGTAQSPPPSGSEPAGASPVPAGTPPPPAAEPTKPPVEETPAAEDTKVPGWKPKKAADWKTVNEDRDKLRTKVAELEGQLQKYTSIKAEEVVKERDELKKLLQTVAAERLPENQGAYKTAMDRAVKKMKQALPAERHAEAERLLRTWDGTEEQVSAWEGMSDGLSMIRSLALTQALGEAQAARETWTQMQQQSAEGWEKWQAQQEQAKMSEMGERRGHFEKLFNQQLGEWKEAGEGSPYFAKEGDPAATGAVQERVELAKHILFGDMKPEDAIRAALWAAAGRGLLEGIQQRDAELAKLGEELKKLQAAQPGGGAPAGSSPPAATTPGGTEGAGDALVKGMFSAGLRF